MPPLLVTLSSLQNNKLLFLLVIHQCNGLLKKLKPNNLGTQWVMYKAVEIITLSKVTNSKVVKETRAGRDKLLVLEIKAIRVGEVNNNNNKENGAKTKVGEVM